MSEKKVVCTTTCNTYALPSLPFSNKMLVLYETAMGYCLFKVSDAAKIGSADLWKEFENPEQANKLCAAIFL
jgi:hypothetical protein